MRAVLIIPTLNAGPFAANLLSAIGKQERHPDDMLVIDSSSSDGTAEIFRSAGIRVITIPRSEFDHGGTRQMAVNLVPEADVVIFITQDVGFFDAKAIGTLLDCFDDARIGAAYGRQIAWPNASPIMAHARMFNYPSKSRLQALVSGSQPGLKAAYLSNSFAAYRRACLATVGGFPPAIIFGEDMYVAAKMLLAGWCIKYCAEAMIYHSHDYGLLEEFKRYFDIGIFHARETWLRKSMGRAEGEGRRMVLSELQYLAKANPWLIPFAILRDGLKFTGYNLGLLEHKFPLSYKARMSMNKAYWAKNER